MRSNKRRSGLPRASTLFRCLGIVALVGVAACGSDSSTDTGTAEPTTPETASSPTTTDSVESTGDVEPTGDQAVTCSDDLVAAATEEGEVVYAGYISEVFATELKAQFEEEYPGITLTYVAGRVGEIQERVTNEQRIGSVQTDVVASGNQYLEVFRQAGLLEPADLEIDEEFTLPVDPDGNWYPQGYIPAGIAVNLDMVDADTITSWTSLTDPEWAGELLMDDPTSGSTGFGFTLEALRSSELGEGFIEALASQDPTFVAGITQPYGQIARGEYPIYFPALEGDAQREKSAGAPIEWILPAEGAYGIAINMGLIMDAPHPNAAKLLMCFVLSEEMQQLRQEIDGIYPSVVRSWAADSPPLMAELDYEARIEETDNAQTINSTYWGL